MNKEISINNLCQVCSREIEDKLSQSELRSSQSDNSPRKNCCAACRKFFWRYQTRRNEFLKSRHCSCLKLKRYDITRCQPCRFRKCMEILGGNMQVKSEDACMAQSSRRDFSKIPCTVCGCSSSGFHFGVVSCEACKGFFRRSMTCKFRKTYYCKASKRSTEEKPGSSKTTINCPLSSNCRQCRLQRCIEVGMSFDEVIVGRHTSRFRKEIDATMEELSKSKLILEKPIHRLIRKSRYFCEDDGEQSNCCGSNNSYGAVTENPAEDAIKTAMAINGGSHHPVSGRTIIVASSSISAPGFASLTLSIPSAPSCLLNSTENSSLEVALGNFFPSCPSFKSLDIEATEWLIDRAVEAAACLAPISSARVIFTDEMTGQEMVAYRTRIFADNYIRSLCDFFKMLPGTSQLSISDRMRVFSNIFFPVVSAQLSLSFDVEHELPNHLSLDRESGTWEKALRGEMGLQRHWLVENFLREAGKQQSAIVSNLKEFALLCALLCFSLDTPAVENIESLQTMRACYELALTHYLSILRDSEWRLEQFYRLLAFFRSSIAVFQDNLHDLPYVCTDFGQSSEPLFKEFLFQFLNVARSYDDTLAHNE